MKDKDKERLNDLSYILLAQAQLIEGLHIESPVEYAEKVCEFISK